MLDATGSATLEIQPEFVSGHEEPRPNVSQLALAAIERFDGDTAKSAKYLLVVLRSQYRTFYDEKADESMLAWAQVLVRGARTRLRSTIATSGRTTEPGAAALSAQSLLDVAAENYMSWPILPGVTLANATRAQILHATSKYRKDANVYLRRANWLDAVAGALPDDLTRVASVMTEHSLAALAREHNV